MDLLNDIYRKSCKPKCESYTKITDNIILIDNFFENFKSAKDFFAGRDKWRCIPYQELSKPGYESFFPNWVGRSLMEKFALDNTLIDCIESYTIGCNFFFDESKPIWSLSNSGYYPHIDELQYENILQHICLINLNDIPISTNFYTFKNQKYCSGEIYEEWKEYTKDVRKELLNYYGKEEITKNEFKDFLDNKQDLCVKLIKEIEYKPNQAIIYPANLFHTAKIPQEFTEDNPRIVLRISFNMKVEPVKNIKYF